MQPCLPLDGLRVVELSTFVATPLGGMTLAQLGADVIRVDPLGGASDVHRWPLAPGGDSLYWAGLNKGKRSIAVDLSSPRGREIVTALATAPGQEGGVFVTNAVKRTWLEDETLRARRPDLIRVGLLGLPDGGAAVDYTVNAALGYPMVSGPTDLDVPVNHVLPAWDVAAGLHVALAVVAAERHRHRTGAGASVTISLWNVALAVAAHLGITANVELGGADRVRDGNYLYGSFGVDFATRDGRRVMVVALTARQWSELVRVCDVGDAVEVLGKALGADFTAEGDRYLHRELLGALLRPWFAARSSEEVARTLAGTGVLWSPYRSFTELVTDPDAPLTANPMMSVLEQPGIGSYAMPGSPLRFGAEHPPARAAPRLGEHGEEILSEVLQLSTTEIGRLHDSGVLG